MPIIFDCVNPECTRTFTVNDERLVGVTRPCPDCGTRNTVPSPHIPPPVVTRPAVVPVPKPVVKPQPSNPIRRVAPHIDPSPNASIPDLSRRAESGDAEAMLRLVYAYKGRCCLLIF